MYAEVKMHARSYCEQCKKDLLKHSSQIISGGWFFCSVKCARKHFEESLSDNE